MFGPKVDFGEADRAGGLAAIDADFRGLLAEAHIAAELGVDLSARVEIEVVDDANLCGFVQNHEGLFRLRTLEARRREAEEALQRSLYAAGGAAYINTMLRFSLQCGLEWTVSARYAHADVRAGASAVAARIRELAAAEAGAPEDAIGLHTAVTTAAELRARLGVIAARESTTVGELARRLRARSDALRKPAFYQSELSRAVTAGDPGVSCEAVGRADVIVSGLVVELKHCAELTEQHRRQAAVYAWLKGAPRALLYNLQTGEHYLVNAADYSAATRALCVARYARAVRNQSGSRAPPCVVAAGRRAAVVLLHGALAFAASGADSAARAIAAAPADPMVVLDGDSLPSGPDAREALADVRRTTTSFACEKSALLSDTLPQWVSNAESPDERVLALALAAAVENSA